MPLSKHCKSPRYDTKEGIQASISGLPDFYRLIVERREAHDLRNECLHGYFVLGRFYFDMNGRVFRVKFGSNAPKDLWPDIPDVLDYEEFADWTAARDDDTDGLRVYFCRDGGHIPPEHVVCPECGKGWTVDNCHDVVAYHEAKEISLAEYAGKSLREAKTLISERTDALYRISERVFLRNDRHIDRSPKYPHSRFSWEKGIRKNPKGWIGAKQGVNDGYAIQDGDEALFDVYTFYHRVCNRRRIEAETKRDIQNIFLNAGFEEVEFFAQYNEHCLAERSSPWHLAVTDIGSFTIGNKGKEICIDWSGVEAKSGRRQEKKAPDIEKLFLREKTRRPGTVIHADSPEKAAEYLSSIRSYIKAHS